MKYIAVIAGIMLAALRVYAVAPSCTGTIKEQTTGGVAVTLCDGTGTQHATCTAAGLTGALVSTSDWTSVEYWVEDRVSGCSLVSATSRDPNANPYTISWTTAAGKIIGKCSTTTATCCAVAADCPAGETCTITRAPVQYHYMTIESQWTGSGQAVETIVICVEDEENYP